jgi:hypothetical protein
MVEESIELVDEVFGRQPVALELEQEGSRMPLELRLTIGGEDEIVKELRVEKTRIRLSGSDPIPCLVCIAGDRDVFPHLATHFKVFGNLVQVTPELIGGWRAVKRRIIAHGPE